jgi:hypothetical protein
VIEPASEEESFLEKEIVGKVKVKHALLGGAGLALGILGIFLVKSRKEK